MYDNQFKYAGFWIRFFAAFIDNIIFFLIFIALMIPFIDFFLNLQENQNMTLVFSVASTVAIGLIKGLFLQSGWQATPGKKVLGLKVVKYDGNKLENLEISTLRESSYGLLGIIISFAIDYFVASNTGVELSKDEGLKDFLDMIISILLGAVWFLPIVFTKEKTAVHDMIFGTRVIYG